MGYGNYSHAAHEALIANRSNQAHAEVFSQRSCHPLMSPKGLTVRESRDSATHPNSLPIIFALDVTGSMGEIPRQLATVELPSFMRILEACQVADPQVLFMAIGDATSDQAPLQVGQFESTAELMDQWLTWSYLEGGGGGNYSESYELAFYVAAQHSYSDAWEKRKKKGYLFITGDEKPYPAVSRHQIDTLMTESLDEDIPIEEVIAAAAETYHVFFLIPDQQRRSRCESTWRRLLGDHVICMDSPSDTCAVAAVIVGLTEGSLKSLDDIVLHLKSQANLSSKTAGVVRAIDAYAASVLKNHSFARTGQMGSVPWWKKIFGDKR